MKGVTMKKIYEYVTWSVREEKVIIIKGMKWKSACYQKECRG